MVELYLVRHGIAAERGKAWPDDSERPLTSRGMKHMRKVVKGLADLDVTLDLVLTSPLVRAKQTAEILRHGLGKDAPLEETTRLGPGGRPVDIIELLKNRKKATRIALVGHEPDMGQLAAFLIGARAPLVFKKGGVCRIDFPKLPPTPPGQLVWFALPDMLR